MGLFSSIQTAEQAKDPKVYLQCALNNLDLFEYYTPSGEMDYLLGFVRMQVEKALILINGKDDSEESIRDLADDEDSLHGREV